MGQVEIMKKYLIISAVFFMFFIGPSFTGATVIQCPAGEKPEYVEITPAVPAIYSCVDTGTWGGWNKMCTEFHQDEGNEKSTPPPFKYTKEELTPAVPAVYEWKCLPDSTIQTAAISATKIVCDSESDLPNWGLGGEDINSDTASNFLEGNNNCHLEDWTFEWSADGVGNPGDNVTTGGDSWNTFTDTAIIPAGARIWVREQMDSDYIPFTYGDNNDNSNNVSAEFYCSTDVLNYDNWDWIDPVVAGKTYYCVGFNVLKESPKQCDIVSDETNIIEDGSSAIETYNYSHPTWFDESLLGGAAKWIWETFKVVDPTVDTTKVFVKKFNLDSTPTSAMIEVAADNGFILEINGIEVVNKIAVENNFGAVTSYDVLSKLVLGENTIRMTVKNFALASSTPEANPAGALYKLHITDSSCSEIPDMCPNINGYQTKIPEEYELDDSGNCVEGQPDLVCDPTINLIQNGDFEQPLINTGTYSIIPDSDTVLKWLIAWVGEPNDGRLGLEIQNNIAGSAYTENQHAELDGDHPVTIWQDIPTIPGKTYKLEFAYSPREGRTADDNEITVKADGGVLGNILSAVGLPSGTDWILETRTFEATGSTTKIEFTDTGTDSSFGGYLDSVGLYCQNNEEESECGDAVCNDDETCSSCPGDCGECDEPKNEPPFANAGIDQEITLPTNSLSLDGSLSSDSDGSIVSYFWRLESGPSPITPQDILSPSFVGLIEGVYIFELTVTDDEGATDKDIVQIIVNHEIISDTCPDGQIMGQEGCYTPTDDKIQGRRSSGSIPQGRVLGASTEEGRVLGESTSCGIYLNKYIKLGDKNNDKEEVKKLQVFLNEYLGLKLDVDGFYGLKTYNAVKVFQLKHQNEVLSPWVGVGKLKNENDPTGYVYKTTQRWINMIKCPELNLPIPELI